jgi:acetylornithine/N-succinyldiaminopimelate aminotransferase
MLGLKLKNVPVPRVVKAAVDEKLLVVGAADNVVRLLPPLNIKDEEIAAAGERLLRAFDRAASASS